MHLDDLLNGIIHLLQRAGSHNPYAEKGNEHTGPSGKTCTSDCRLFSFFDSVARACLFSSRDPFSTKALGK